MISRINAAIDNHGAETHGGAEEAAVTSAEDQIGFRFPEDYRLFLLHYGALKHDGNEIYGIGPTGYCSVVGATMEERKLSSNFPKDCAVLFNLGMEGVLILLRADGVVYEYSPYGMKSIFPSFTKWLEEEFFSL